MQSLQYFDGHIFKIPLECCYCNTAIGNEKFIIKKAVKKDRLVQKYVQEFPICHDCKRRYRSRLIISYIGGIIVFSFLIILLTVLSVEVNAAWLTIIEIIVLERGFQYVFGKYVIEPLRPVNLNVNGGFSFHNKDYQGRFYELNYPATPAEIVDH
jgi:hypothetical protein